MIDAQRQRVPRGVLLLLLVAGFGFGFVKAAAANHFHTSGNSCSSAHGFVHGDSTTDGSFHARVEQGTCPPTYHSCTLSRQSPYLFLGSDAVYFGTCNFRYSGSVSESNGQAGVYYETQFNSHTHYPH